MNSQWNLDLYGDLDLEYNLAIQSFHEAIQPMIMYQQTKFGCKRISSSEDKVRGWILIIWASAWPWPWTQKINLFAWYFKSWWCITISSLVIKASVAQKISSRLTFIDILNFHCDLDLKYNNPVFTQDFPAYDNVPPAEFDYKRISSLEDIVETVKFWSYEYSVSLRPEK